MVHSETEKESSSFVLFFLCAMIFAVFVCAACSSCQYVVPFFDWQIGSTTPQIQLFRRGIGYIYILYSISCIEFYRKIHNFSIINLE